MLQSGIPDMRLDHGSAEGRLPLGSKTPAAQ